MDSSERPHLIAIDFLRDTAATSADVFIDGAEEVRPLAASANWSSRLVHILYLGDTMAALYYLAYGSNLHPARILTRVPSVKVVGTVEMTGCSLAFHKRSSDGSGKCSIRLHDDARVVGETLMVSGGGQNPIAPPMFGVLYELDPSDQANLRAAEGTLGYSERVVGCTVNGTQYVGVTYIAQSSHIDPSLRPYQWYKDFVVEGARYHAFPQAYVDTIAAVDAIPDPDAKRLMKETLLLRQVEVLPIANIPI